MVADAEINTQALRWAQEVQRERKDYMSKGYKNHKEEIYRDSLLELLEIHGLWTDILGDYIRPNLFLIFISNAWLNYEMKVYYVKKNQKKSYFIGFTLWM